MKKGCNRETPYCIKHIIMIYNSCTVDIIKLITCQVESNCQQKYFNKTQLIVTINMLFPMVDSCSENTNN